MAHEELADLMATRGVRLPVLVQQAEQAVSRTALRVILNHGLGAKDPATKGYEDDDWIRLVGENASASGLVPVLYTARGHKGSSGWEVQAAEGHLSQFTWDHLSHDMVAVAREHLKLDSFVVGGSSMGSATALYAVINYHSVAECFIRGLILIRPPTAWETRKARRKFLQGSAKKCHQRYLDKGVNDSLAHLVLLGAADADLPSKTEGVEETYGRIRCPTLILAIENDDAHPLETATALHSLIRGSVLHIARDFTQACQDWPLVVQQFTASL